MKDLLESLTFFDVAHHAGVNPKAVKIEKVKELLDKMEITDVVSFGEFFGNEKPFIKFASIYRDVYIFDVDYNEALELNL